MRLLTTTALFSIATSAILLLGSVCAVDGARDFSRLRAAGLDSLRTLAASPGSEVDLNGLSLLYPRPDVIRERLPFLIQHRWSVFRNPDNPADLH